jgi:hypothetical protein
MGNILSDNTSVDAGGRHVVGPANYLPAGTRVGSTDYALTHVLLVDAANNALVVAVDLDSGGGTANRMGTAILVPASGGPAVVPGDATNGLKVQTAASAVVTPTHTAPSATTTTSALLATNANRRYALLQNIGSVDVFVKIGASAVASQGIRLVSGGGYYEMSGAFGNLMTGAINGITASGTATVLVTEGV